MKKLLLLFIISTITINNQKVQAQMLNDSLDTVSDSLALLSAPYQTDLPTLVPPAPETAALMRYIENSLDHSSGTMSLSLPVYEINHGSLSLSITANYDGSGRRVSDVSGPIGIGWSLNTGGVIARTIKGKPDNVYPVYKNYVEKLLDYSTKYNVNEYHELTHGLYYSSGSWGDTEYDIFSYAIPGYTGYFIFDGASTSIVKMDNNPITITGNNSSMDNFIITDDKGIKYNFTASETVSMGTYGTQKIGWHLSYITSADGLFQIKFTYKEGMSSYKPLSITESLQVIDRIENFASFSGSTSLIINQDPYGFDSYQSPRIAQIEFGNNKLIFVSDDSNTIEEIILQRSNKNIKSLQLNHSISEILHSGYLPLENYKLDSWIWKDRNNNAIEKYSFEYYSSTDFYSSDTDYWGFRNRTKTSGVFPTMDIKRTPQVFQNETTIPMGKADRNPNYTKAMEGVLKKVTYPTGGALEFEYEANRYKIIGRLPQNIEKEAGGIRLSKVITSDLNGNITTKTYEYGPGRIKIDPNKLVDNMKEYYVAHFGRGEDGKSPANSILYAYRVRIFSSEFGSELSYLASLPTFYETITEYVNNQSNSNKYKTIYTYSDRNYNVITRPWPVPSYSNHLDIEYFRSLRYPFQYSSMKSHIDNYDHFWKKNNLTSKQEFKNNGSGVYEPVRLTTYTYKDTELEKYKCALLVLNVELTPLNNSVNPTLEYIQRMIMHQTSGMYPLFSHPGYTLVRGKSELESVSETMYTPSGTYVTKTTYKYNDYSLPSKVTTTNSNGKVFEENIEYTFDYSGNAIYDAMKRKGMFNFPVKKSRYVDNMYLENMTTTYNLFQSAFYLPEKVFSNKKDNTQGNLRITYHNYDKYGNPAYISKDDATKIVYLWSYNGQYPVAEIQNVTYDQVKSALGGEQVINTIASSNMLSDADRVKINNLRNNTTYLKDALITTYTYKPLIGVNTITDPRGVITTYDYDDFGRLISIKDHNGKLIEEYQYNYRNK